MRKRTQSRELALQILYQVDVRGPEVLDEIDDLLREQTQDAEVIQFARGIVVGTWEHRAQIDESIAAVATNWDLPRMAVVDRNILRLATYELCFCDDIPPLVSINEAIEMAKKFSTKNSGPFVNGILDNVRLRCAPPAKQKK
ncbi:MAG: transcription antitermination factor NusB [Planctomycetes bacterium]|nr:transcription antitermination factor NusB [Planctomycetota bacterium]